jgi:hypothetical protein
VYKRRNATILNLSIKSAINIEALDEFWAKFEAARTRSLLHMATGASGSSERVKNKLVPGSRILDSLTSGQSDAGPEYGHDSQ